MIQLLLKCYTPKGFSGYNQYYENETVTKTIKIWEDIQYLAIACSVITVLAICIPLPFTVSIIIPGQFTNGIISLSMVVAGIAILCFILLVADYAGSKQKEIRKQENIRLTAEYTNELTQLH